MELAIERGEEIPALVYEVRPTVRPESCRGPWLDNAIVRSEVEEVVGMSGILDREDDRVTWSLSFQAHL